MELYVKNQILTHVLIKDKVTGQENLNHMRGYGLNLMNIFIISAES